MALAYFGNWILILANNEILVTYSWILCTTFKPILSYLAHIQLILTVKIYDFSTIFEHISFQFITLLQILLTFKIFILLLNAWLSLENLTYFDIN